MGLRDDDSLGAVDPFLRNALFGLLHVESGASIERVLVYRLLLHLPSAIQNDFVLGLSIAPFGKLLLSNHRLVLTRTSDW
jgi:hypothetical protein